MPEINLPPTDAERTIRSATDSEDLVRRLVSEGAHSTDIHDTIKRNTDHLRIVLERPEVVATNSPKLVDFQDAVDLGEAFITEQE